MSVLVRRFYDPKLPAEAQESNATLDAIAALSTTGLIVRTGAGTAATRTITGTANQIAATNGDGVAGNPTLSIPAIFDLTGKTFKTDGVTFPATQVPSADVNTLDDYEEGTFLPTLTFATPGNLSVVYATQSGRYTKIGNVVFFNWRIVTSTFTHTSASGIMILGGLPFTAAAGEHGAIACMMQGYTKANYTFVAFRVVGATITGNIIAGGSGQANAGLTAADMPTAGTVDILVNGHYSV